MVDGLPMYARVSEALAPPNSPAVVLVHGFIISSRYMVPVAKSLAPHFRVYAPDLPGFGNTGEPGRVLDVAELADALARWMEVVGLERAILLGNSFGCQTVAHFAVRHPARVERAVLVGPTVDPQRRTVLGQALQLARDAPRERIPLWLIHIPDYFKAGVRRILCTAQYALTDRIEETVRHVHVPTLVVRGERDPIVPQRWAEELTNLLPRGRLVVIPGGAHALNYSSPRQLACVVQAFLAVDQGADPAMSTSGRAG